MGARRQQVTAADLRLLRRLTKRRRSGLDWSMVLLSSAADRARLWIGVAAVIALAVPRGGARAAGRGLLCIAVTSALVNGPLKILAGRKRPSEPLTGALGRRLRVPVTSSFPSGHSASAFAFATGAGLQLPVLAIPLGALATAVAYSRIHTRLHYPTDVVAGSAIGFATALATNRLLDDMPRALGHIRSETEDRRPAPRFKQVILVISPHAGRAARGLGQARTALRAAGLQVVEEVSVDRVQRVRELLRARPEEPLLVAAAGGDGTVGAVADVLNGSRAVMGVIPLGTSNDFARSLGIPIDVKKAIALFSEGKVSTIDLGRIELPDGSAMHFVHAATAGLNVSFARLATRASFRKRLGRLAYAAAAAVAIREHQPFHCAVVVEGRQQDLDPAMAQVLREGVDLAHLSVINAPVFGGFLGMRMRHSSVDDRLLDVLAVDSVSLGRVVLAAFLALLKVRGPLAGIRSLHVRRMTVRTDHPLEVALDGEVRGKLPAAFAVAGEALRVVTPQEFVDVDE